MAGLFAVCLCGWAGNPFAGVAPVDNEPALRADDCTTPERCPLVAGSDSTLTRWISRTQGGNLFLMMQTRCADPAQCSAWFVERTDRGMDMRLSLDGRFRVLNSGKPVPDVQTWRPVSDNEILYTRYAWVAGAYLKTETRSVYRIDGVECGTALECYQKANAAHDNRHTDQALRIWETVHNLSWI
jgi:hypothetical protein